jgi:lipopolysaccharide export LptBFGC system permease protein LptF
MSTFGTYVFRQAFSALALILFSLIGVVWIALALKKLKLVTSKGQDIVT